MDIKTYISCGSEIPCSDSKSNKNDFQVNKNGVQSGLKRLELSFQRIALQRFSDLSEVNLVTQSWVCSEIGFFYSSIDKCD